MSKLISSFMNACMPQNPLSLCAMVDGPFHDSLESYFYALG